MIISHSKKFCYWKIARTGSNTVELCIRMSGMLDLSQDIVMSTHFFPGEHNVIETDKFTTGHLLPRNAIRLGFLTQEQYEHYDHYTIVRDPLQRWISAYGWRCRNHQKLRITPIEFYENNRNDIVCRNQSDYLSLGGIRTFPFSDFENSVKTIVQLIGGHLEDVPFVAHTKQVRVMRECEIEVAENDAELGCKILDRYTNDCNLNY